MLRQERDAAGRGAGEAVLARARAAPGGAHEARALRERGWRGLRIGFAGRLGRGIRWAARGRVQRGRRGPGVPHGLGSRGSIARGAPRPGRRRFATAWARRLAGGPQVPGLTGRERDEDQQAVGPESIPSTEGTHGPQGTKSRAGVLGPSAAQRSRGSRFVVSRSRLYRPYRPAGTSNRPSAVGTSRLGQPLSGK